MKTMFAPSQNGDHFERSKKPPMARDAIASAGRSAASMDSWKEICYELEMFNGCWFGSDLSCSVSFSILNFHSRWRLSFIFMKWKWLKCLDTSTLFCSLFAFCLLMRSRHLSHNNVCLLNYCWKNSRWDEADSTLHLKEYTANIAIKWSTFVPLSHLRVPLNDRRRRKKETDLVFPSTDSRESFSDVEDSDNPSDKSHLFDSCFCWNRTFTEIYQHILSFSQSIFCI